MVILPVSENCFLLQKKYCNISCFWETQPSGCLRITCAFHHSKPRNINGLFLPPSNNAPLQQGVQEGILQPARRQESLRKQENILLPIHPPLIINLNDEEDDEEDDEEEENYVSDWVPKTDAEIEEERAIKEICYKSGEYYGIQYPHEHQSTKTVPSPRNNELLPLEATERDLQKGESYVLTVTTHQRNQEMSHEKLLGRSDGNTIPTKINNAKGEGGSSERRAPTESIPRPDRRSFGNGGIHTSDPKVKQGYQQRGQSKDDETASSIPYVRESGRKTYFSSSEPRRSAYVVYRTVTATQEPKLNGSAAVPEPRGGKCSRQKNQLDTKRRFGTQMENYDKYTSGSYNAPTWRNRYPRAKTFSKFKTTSQQSQEDMEVNQKGERYVDRRKR
ncbi:uncharacterized protein C12orf50 homolog [Ciconia boyciana]|uniref:uncharacterized protein C12orf50 homolog n=1 Tax=Ciconia boyciana TaxID=52775 RepID=UPI003BA12304